MSISPSGYGKADAQAWAPVSRATKQASSVAGANMLPTPMAQAPISQANPASVAQTAVLLLAILIGIRVAEHYAQG